MIIKKISELNKNQCGKVLNVQGDVFLRRRLLELGFIKGVTVKVNSVSPLKNTYLLTVQDYTLALRKNSLDLINVVVDE